MQICLRFADTIILPLSLKLLSGFPFCIIFFSATQPVYSDGDRLMISTLDLIGDVEVVDTTDLLLAVTISL